MKTLDLPMRHARPFVETERANDFGHVTQEFSVSAAA
jgi:hypothetical protein